MTALNALNTTIVSPSGRWRRGIALDVDSTVYDLIGAMNDVEGTPEMSAHGLTHWDHLAEICGDRLFELFDHAMSFDVMAKYAPFEGVRDALETFAANEIEVHVMTMRPDRFLDDVRRWFNHYELPVTSVQCQMPMNKTELCLTQNLGIIVDDSPTTLHQAHNSGIQCLTLDYAYNRPVIAENPGILVTDAWHKMTDLVLESVEKLGRRGLSSAR